MTRSDVSWGKGIQVPIILMSRHFGMLPSARGFQKLDSSEQTKTDGTNQPIQLAIGKTVRLLTMRRVLAWMLKILRYMKQMKIFGSASATG